MENKVNNIFIAKAITSRLFIGENGEIITDPLKAKKFTYVGDCMKACIEANENLGKAAFRFCEINENELHKL